MSKLIGILTSGGDTPGLNAALRAVGKAAELRHGMQVIGFRDGFRGLMENRTVWLDEKTLSGILTHGGTILGTSRDKPNAMPVAGWISTQGVVKHQSARTTRRLTTAWAATEPLRLAKNM